jgi:hypothetical protein
VIYTNKDNLHKTSHDLLFFAIYRDFSSFSQRVKSETYAFYQVNTVFFIRVPGSKSSQTVVVVLVSTRRYKRSRYAFMNSPDKPETTTESFEDTDEVSRPTPDIDSTTTSKPSQPQSQGNNFDWKALGIVILIAAFFAITARLHAQPATSFVPTVVLSATGCGLLVTAIRKLRTLKGIGLREAALGGFFMALIQFMVAITYPGIFDFIGTGQIIGNEFLITWMLIVVFSIIFSVAGAALGHLSFAPLRPLPTRSSARDSIDEATVSTASSSEDEHSSTGTSDHDLQYEDLSENPASHQTQRSVISLLITILLLGLAPTIAAYIFSAAYDFILSFNQFVPGPYPTLRILSALLPWQVPIPIDLNSSIQNVIIFSLLWRIPLLLGNPTLFDLQALEPYIFNGAALALLLLTMYRPGIRRANQFTFPGWISFLTMEAVLGLIMVLPANLWVLRGLEGLVQFHDIVIPIRTISILDPLTFTLNLITGPLVCVGLGVALRIFLSKRRV